MNTPSPLVPQGATPPKPKSSLYFKVLMILSVHVVVIGGMLLQGCKDNAKDQTKADSTGPTAGDTMAMTISNSTPMTAPISTTTDVPPTVNPNIQAAYSGTAVTAAPAAPPMPPATSLVPPARASDLTASAPGETKEYVIAHGDTLGLIAKRNGLSLKALMAANPSVEPRKLQVGQKIQIPAAAAVVASATTTGATTEAVPGDGSVYVVKSGDMLFKIARSHGTSVKKIMAMNELKTTSIRAGQKLKLPAPKVTSSEPMTSPATASVATPAAASPTRVSAITPAPVGTVAAN
jgi:LysM repeat protein